MSNKNHLQNNKRAKTKIVKTFNKIKKIKLIKIKNYQKKKSIRI